MRNAAEMAIDEFSGPNIQILVKDDSGTAEAARVAAQQALDEGAEIILGPLFAQSVSFVGQVAQSRNVPVIAFSTDANVASRGVYLLSFLPESDVDRIVQYASLDRETLLRGAHSRQSLWHRGRSGVQAGGGAAQRARSSALERYPHDKAAHGRRRSAISRRLRHAPTHCSFPTAATRCRMWSRAWSPTASISSGCSFSAPGLWDDPRIFATPALDGGWYAAPDGTGYRNFAARYRDRYKQDPVRTATLAYDAVALIAALVKTQGAAAIFAGSADQSVGLFRH